MFQLYVFAPPAVKVTICPAQIVEDEPLIETVGVGKTEIVFTAEFEQLPEEPTRL